MLKVNNKYFMVKANVNHTIDDIFDAEYPDRNQTVSNVPGIEIPSMPNT
jgi:hypothetical protein